MRVNRKVEGTKQIKEPFFIELVKAVMDPNSWYWDYYIIMQDYFLLMVYRLVFKL